MNYVANITPEHNTLILNLGEMYADILPTSGTIDISLTSTPFELLDNIYLNSVKGLTNMKVSVYPYITTLRLAVDSKNYQTGIITMYIDDIPKITIYVDDYDVQRFIDSDKEAKQIKSKLETFMLLRTNPKLSGNIKLVVDSNYHLYLDTFKVSSVLNNRIYRKYPISSQGNYPYDVMTVFSKLPKSELFKLPTDSLNPKKFYNDYTDLYFTEYEYGAQTNDDNLYSENMRILAPLHIGKHIPDFFVIFRYDEPFNKESYLATDINDTSKFNNLLKDSSVVKIFDLRTYTTIGQYLNNYKDSIKEFLYGSCYMQFIEQDNEKYGPNYRQGNNSWRGIDVSKGIISNKVETSYFANNILEKNENVQETFNDYIINGYQRNNVLYPYIINLEFLFDDKSSEEFSMHRYFGLYMSSNEIVDYDCIVSEVLHGNSISNKFDVDNNIINDNTIIKNMFVEKYSDRMFFMTTNNDAMRVLNPQDIQHFISEYVLDNPDKTICSMKSEIMQWHNNEESFITLSFDEPIKYGEHIRFIAQNVYNENSKMYENVCLELVASNDNRLKTTDDNISPYISTNTTDSDTSSTINNNIYRISFYTQSLTDEFVPATLPEQFARIKACIYKFNQFINFEDSSDDTISFTSVYENVYCQHILPVNMYDEPEYKELYINSDKLYYTDNVLSSDNDKSYINYIKTFVNIQSGLATDMSHVNDKIYSKTNINRISTYVDYEDPKNIKKDTIRYFSKNIDSYVYPISPNTNYYSDNYKVFSLYGYELLGWRYSNIIKFKKISDLNYTYAVYGDIENIIKNVRHPLIKNTDGSFEVIEDISVNEGYLTDNVIRELEVSAYQNTYTQNIIMKDYSRKAIINPYNVKKSIINLYNPALIYNYQMNVYNPESASINVMGIYGIKDIDMSVEYEQSQHISSDDMTVIPEGTVIEINGQNNSLISKGVLYKIIKGGFNEFSAYIFIIIGNKLYTLDNSNNINDISFSKGTLTVSSELHISTLSESDSLVYDFMKSIPTQKIDNFYVDKKKRDRLYISIVPLTNCLWESNGLYFDMNSTLNTDELTTNDYKKTGYFTEHIVAPGIDSFTNRYIRNGVDSFVNIDGEIKSFKELIRSGKLKNPIKKLLILNNNIDTAVGYYNTYVQSLEFIYYGIKFNIKFDSEYYTQNLRIGEYNNFEVFIINDYDVQKNNEIYISVDEEMILVINHKYDVNGLSKSYNQLFMTSDSEDLQAPYGVYKSPYSLYSNSLFGTSNSLMGAKTSQQFMNITSDVDRVYFVQDDLPDEQYGSNPDIIPNYFFFKYMDNRVKIKDNKTNIIVNSSDTSIGCLKYTDSDHKYSISEYTVQSDKDLWSPAYRKNVAYVTIKKKDTTESKNDNSKSLLRYVNSFGTDYDCYIINNGVCQDISISRNYLPVKIDLSVPNKIKYNFGYFMPYFYDIVEFKQNDYELLDSLNINLLLANTKLSTVNKLKSYSGNKIFSQNVTVDNNYFLINNKSVMLSNWDNNYYRNYNDSAQDTFKYIPGYIPGIDDKSFFGSRCMVFKDNHIVINDFSGTRSIKTSLTQIDSKNNIYTKNKSQYKLAINITQCIYYLFQNNESFIDNWNGLSKDVDTSMKNYIKNTISKIYNMLRSIDVVIYAQDQLSGTVTLLTEQISDYTNWKMIDGFDTEFTVDNNDMILTIVFDDIRDSLIHPQIKISRI